MSYIISYINLISIKLKCYKKSHILKTYKNKEAKIKVRYEDNQSSDKERYMLRNTNYESHALHRDLIRR